MSKKYATRETRLVHRFLLLPRRIGGRWRWLVWARFTRRRILYYKRSGATEHWETIRVVVERRRRM